MNQILNKQRAKKKRADMAKRAKLRKGQDQPTAEIVVVKRTMSRRSSTLKKSKTAMFTGAMARDALSESVFENSGAVNGNFSLLEANAAF